MGIYGMMRTGVSGMNAQSNRLSGVADNVANSGTTGYKRTDTQFSTLVVPSTRNSYQSGGVNTHVSHDILKQGVSRVTSNSGDAMISGNGFYRVQDSNGVEYMTRAGSFQRDGEGYLQNANGYYLLDDNGERIRIKAGPADLMPGGASSNIDMDMNLDSGEDVISRFGDNGVVPAIPAVPFDKDKADSYTEKKSVTVHDRQGNKVNLDMYMSKTGENQWEMRLYAGDRAVQNGENIQLQFDSDGNLTSPVPGPTITLEGSGNTPYDISLNFGNGTEAGKMITQKGADSSFQLSANGMAPGAYESFTFGKRGEVMVSYTNGKIVHHSTVGMTTVTSPNLLTVLSGTVFQANSETGAQIYGSPGEGTFGQLQSGVLEESNADIGNELTDMIEAQRSYTANSKVFQTGSELLDVIVNLKR